MRILEQSDHLIVELLGDGVALVVIQERGEVQLGRDLLRLQTSQSRPGTRFYNDSNTTWAKTIFIL